jgi:aminopeptidase
MDLMRGDMGGAACVVSALLAAVRMSLPINITVLAPLCENMPSGNAVKPGDVVEAMNGKTIQLIWQHLRGLWMLLLEQVHVVCSPTVMIFG